VGPVAGRAPPVAAASAEWLVSEVVWSVQRTVGGGGGELRVVAGELELSTLPRRATTPGPTGEKVNRSRRLPSLAADGAAWNIPDAADRVGGPDLVVHVQQGHLAAHFEPREHP